jgi:hypothetical protein
MFHPLAFFLDLEGYPRSASCPLYYRVFSRRFVVVVRLTSAALARS